MIFNYKIYIAKLISNSYSFLSENDVLSLITVPPSKDLGDFTFPCFNLAKQLKKKPNLIASDFVQDKNKDKNKNLSDNKDYFSNIEAHGPYINFFLNKKNFIIRTLNWAMQVNENSLKHLGKGQKILIDFSSPNIAKPFSIAHLRSTSIGNALYKILTYAGYKVIRINHIGDWGTSFGKLICAYKRWGKDLNMSQKPINKMLELYVRFHKEQVQNSSLNEEAKAYFKALEDGQAEPARIWQKFRDLSLIEFKRIYDLLNVSFDHFTGESFYQDKINKTLKVIADKGLTKESEGALVIDLGDKVPFLLKKQDGASLYGTRDIAAALYRKEEYLFDKMLYVVGSEQSLYFKQLFTVLKKTDIIKSDECEHIKFGLMHFKDTKMSTREGNVIFLEEVIEKAKQKTLEKLLENEVLKKESSKEEEFSKEEGSKEEGSKEEVKSGKAKFLLSKEMGKHALELGVSSVIFFDLKNNRTRDYTFSWEEVLNPKGETGIYIQYAHARLCGIERKYLNAFEKDGILPESISMISDESSYLIAWELSQFHEMVKKSVLGRDPSIIARYILDLAKQFSIYYKAHKVVNLDDYNLSKERIISVIAVKRILSLGLMLLGIKPLEKI